MTTYADLLHVLSEGPEELLNQTITVFVPGVDEYYPATIMITDEECDVLDPGHLVITLAREEPEPGRASERTRTPFVPGLEDWQPETDEDE